MAIKSKLRSHTIEAATKLFCEFGYDRTTFTMVASKSGYSRTAIINHFGGKRELLYAVMETYHCLMQEALDRPVTGNLAHDVIRLSCDYSTFLKGHPETLGLIHLAATMSRNNPSLKEGESTFVDQAVERQLPIVDGLLELYSTPLYEKHWNVRDEIRKDRVLLLQTLDSVLLGPILAQHIWESIGLQWAPFDHVSHAENFLLRWTSLSATDISTAVSDFRASKHHAK